jgi:hypothetical protein
VRAARVLVLLVAGLAVLPAAARGQGESPVELSEATIVEREGAAEVWVRLSRPTKYQAELMDSPWRLVLDFEDTAYRWSVRPQPIEADPVRELRGSQYRKGVARLVIELRRKVAYVVEQDREGLRIVLPREAVAAVPAPAPTARATPAPVPRSTSKEPLVYGIVTLNQQAHAYIFDPATQQVRRYAVGDTVGSGIVETIGERSVVLKTPTGRVELRVEEVKPDVLPAPPPTLTPRGVRPAPAPVGPSPTPPRS